MGTDAIFVTGGAGFVGRHLLTRLGAADITLLVREPEVDLPPARLVIGNVADAFEIPRGASVYHLAAASYVPDTLKQPLGTYETNLTGTLQVLEAARKADASSIVLASTAHVYGAPANFPVTEEHSLAPTSPYGGSKAAADIAGQLYARTYGLRVVIPRFFNLYGPGQKGDFLVPSLLRQMLAGATVTMGDPEPKRDFTYIEDGVDALVAAARVADTTGRVVNVASGRTVSAGEIAERLAHIVGYQGKIHHDLSRRRVGEIMDFTVDTSRSASLLNWKATTTLEEGLRRTADWARSHGALI